MRATSNSCSRLPSTARSRDDQSSAGEVTGFGTRLRAGDGGRGGSAVEAAASAATADPVAASADGVANGANSVAGATSAEAAEIGAASALPERRAGV